MPYDHVLYTFPDAGRELPGGTVLTPGVPVAPDAIDPKLAAVLVQRGDCVWCDAEGTPRPESPEVAEAAESPEVAEAAESPEVAEAAESPEVAEAAESPEVAEAAESPEAAPKASKSK